MKVDLQDDDFLYQLTRLYKNVIAGYNRDGYGKDFLNVTDGKNNVEMVLSIRKTEEK